MLKIYQDLKKYAELRKKRVLPIEDTYSYLTNIDFSTAKKIIPKKTRNKEWRLNWIIHPLEYGAGGFMILFRAIKYFEKMGHKNKIFVFDPHQNTVLGLEDSRKLIRHKYGLKKTSLYFGTVNMPYSDVAFSTTWYTTYPLFKDKKAGMKYFFAQDYEPYFYPLGSENKFAENSYRLKIKCITDGPWLAEKIRNKFKVETDYFDLAYDQKIYFPEKQTKRQSNQIAFFARSKTSRRGVELGILALNLLHKKIKKIKIVFFGQKDDFLPTRLPYINKGLLNEEELARLYNRSTIGMALSLTNHSIITREMMACGLPVVDIKAKNTTSIFGQDEEAITLADPNPNSIAKKIYHLLTNKDKHRQMQLKGYQKVKTFTWDKSMKKLYKIVAADITNINE